MNTAMILYTLLTTQLTILCVTLYLHRSITHRGVVFHPIVSHAMRLWLWLTTGMRTRDWVAIHRQHHNDSDGERDPHSPHRWGIWRVLFGGVFYYIRGARDTHAMEQWGRGVPDDWIERHLYSRFTFGGVVLLLLIDVGLWGWWGSLIWLIQIAWIPFWAAGVINGLGHWCGYRNGDSGDRSRNLLPWGMWIGGEELHNNHHLDPASPKFSRKWWEIDVGWCVIRALVALRLATPRRASQS